MESCKYNGSPFRMIHLTVSWASSHLMSLQINKQARARCRWPREADRNPACAVRFSAAHAQLVNALHAKNYATVALKVATLPARRWQ